MNAQMCDLANQIEITATYESLSERAKSHMEIMSLSTQGNGLLCVNNKGEIIFADNDSYKMLHYPSLVGMKLFGDKLCVPHQASARDRQIALDEYCPSLEDELIKHMHCEASATSEHACEMRDYAGRIQSYQMILYAEAEPVLVDGSPSIETDEIGAVLPVWHRWCFVVIIPVQDQHKRWSRRKVANNIYRFNQPKKGLKITDSFVFQAYRALWRADKKIALSIPFGIGLLSAFTINPEWTQRSIDFLRNVF